MAKKSQKQMAEQRKKSAKAKSRTTKSKRSSRGANKFAGGR